MGEGTHGRACGMHCCIVCTHGDRELTQVKCRALVECRYSSTGHAQFEWRVPRAVITLWRRRQRWCRDLVCRAPEPGKVGRGNNGAWPTTCLLKPSARKWGCNRCTTASSPVCADDRLYFMPQCSLPRSTPEAWTDRRPPRQQPQKSQPGVHCCIPMVVCMIYSCCDYHSRMRLGVSRLS